MRAASAGLLALALLAGPAAAAEAPGSDAARLISKTVDDVLLVLNDPELDSAGRRKRIETIAYELFDFTTVSRLVVARYWQRFDAEQQQELVRFRQEGVPNDLYESIMNSHRVLPVMEVMVSLRITMRFIFFGSNSVNSGAPCCAMITSSPSCLPASSERISTSP